MAKPPEFSAQWQTPNFVPIDEDYALPREFQVTTEPNGSEATLDVVVDDNGVARCTRLEVHESEDEGITTETLRGVAVGRLLRLGTTAVLMKVKRTKGGVQFVPADNEDKRQFYGRYADARRPRRGSPIRDEQLEKVARTYRQAVAGGLSPTLQVAETMNVSRSTAARWVARARQEGHLGKARRGRAGEAS